MADTPAKYAEIEEALAAATGQTLSEFIAAGRENNAPWRRLAADVEEHTGIKVSHEALRIWTLGRPAVGSGSAA